MKRGPAFNLYTSLVRWWEVKRYFHCIPALLSVSGLFDPNHRAAEDALMLRARPQSADDNCRVFADVVYLCWRGQPDRRRGAQQTVVLKVSLTCAPRATKPPFYLAKARILWGIRFVHDVDLGRRVIAPAW